MTVKMLYVMSVLTLSSAGALLVSCATPWLGSMPLHDIDLGPSAAEQFLALRHEGGTDNSDVMAPLIREAQAFALYLCPPEPPTPPMVTRETPLPRVSPPQPTPRSAPATPWFNLVATSYNRRRPEQSWALISEPGKGGRWARKGDQLGHFIIESVEETGRIVYRDGNQSREMAIPSAATVAVARLRSDTPVSAQNLPVKSRLVSRPPASDGGIAAPDMQSSEQELR